MASKKNTWRTRGRFQFRRETKRYSDGSPWGCDLLYIRVRKVACAIVEPFDWRGASPGSTVSVLCGTYRAARPAPPARRTWRGPICCHA